MAADVALDPGSSNPCCAELNKKYLKVRSDRSALRQGLEELAARMENFVKENAQLKKALKEMQLRGKQEKEEKVEEFSIRQTLEREIQKLKSEMSSYEKNECSMKVNNNEIQMLKVSILEGQNEITRLRELLEKEKTKYENEMKKAESDQKKAAEAWKLVKLEKNNAEEGRKLAERERKKAEEYRICLEKAKTEVKEVRRKLKEELSKADDARKIIESEKQKTNSEKARADSEGIIANEQKRLMEVERKKTNNEKVRADRLSQMLEEEKQQREELQKKIERHTWYREEKYHGDFSNASAKIKLLSKQLKLEKKQVRYAKRIAKLEKAEKSYVMQELDVLKQSFMQILFRFNMLDDRLSHNVEGTDAVAKSGKSSVIHGFKLQNNLLCSERCNHYPVTDCGLTKPCCMGSFNFTEPTRERVSLSIPRGSCTRSTTGIISELESPVGGSDRNKSQSSAICSNTSNSDKRSMDSQGRGSITVTASAKQTKQHANTRPTVMKLSSEVDKTRKNKKLSVVENFVDKTSGHTEAVNACLTACQNDVLVLDGNFDRASKRRKVNDIVEPVEHIQSHLKIGGKLSLFKDNVSIEGEVTVASCSQGCGISQNFLNRSACFSKNHNEICRQNSNHRSNKMKSKHQLPALQSLGQNDTEQQGGKFDGQRNKDPSFVAGNMQSSHQLRKNGNIEQEGNAISYKQADLIGFEKMIHGNCLKLLDLDNDADEERYRMAVQRPLSPSLTDFSLPNLELCVECDAKCVMERGKPGPLNPLDITLTESRATVKARQGRLDNLKSSWNHVPLDVEQMYPSGKSGDKKIDTVAESLLGSDKAFPKPNIGGDSLSDVIDKPLTSYDFSGSCESDDVCLQSSTAMVDNVVRNSSPVVNRQNKACEFVGIMASDLVEKQIEGGENAPDGTISSSCTKQVLSVEVEQCTKAGENIFNAEVAQPGSIPQLSDASKEPALSINCSFNDSSRTNHDDKVGMTSLFDCILFPNIKDKDSISRLQHMRKAISHQSFMVSQMDNVVVQLHNALAADAVFLPEEKGSVFLSLFLFNISNRMSANFIGSIEHLLPFFESFAVEISKVLTNVETKTLLEEICQLDVIACLVEDFLIERKFVVCADSFPDCNDTSSSLFQLDEVSISSRDATIHQFVAGCIILASISAAAKRIDFVLGASYRILRMCKLDSSWVLLALHIFASVCGKNFFDVKEYGFLIVALQSMVLLLERGHQFFISSPRHCTMSEMEPSFHPCKECPFARGAVCMDKLVTLLLDVVQCFALAGAGCPNANSSVNCSLSMVPELAERKEERCGQSNVSYVSCYLFISKKHVADLPDCFSEGAFCHFNDIVSLLELVGCYMNWEWIYNKIIPCLTNVLKICKHEEFSAALFVLIGHLGRFGIDVSGQQEEGIVELRSSISMFVDTSCATKMHFPTQLAAVGAILNLLPLSFGNIIGESEELTMETSQYDHVKLIKRWFSKLSKQEQSVSDFVWTKDNSSENNMSC